MPTVEVQSKTLLRLKRDMEAYDRLLLDCTTKLQYWRLKEIYWGRMYRTLRENDLI